MNDIKFSLTIEQIKDIYDAGVRRGEYQQSAYDWGSNARGKHYDECVDALHDIMNEGVLFDDARYVSLKDVEVFFKK